MWPTFFDQSPEPVLLAVLVAAVLLALAFEVVNGFHDTANAVATVIYTNTLKPVPAVLWSGVANFAGVIVSGVAVAYSIVNLFPQQALEQLDSGGDGFAMILAVLLAAIIWNLATWYAGIPASSSHTMIGAILGVAIAHSLVSGIPLAQGVRWDKALDVARGLLIAPAIGFFAAALMMKTLKRLFPRPELHSEPPAGKAPPLPIRMLLIATSGGVSFAHGSNDGQKGMGLVMLILIGLAPASFALNLRASSAHIARVSADCRQAAFQLSPPESSELTLAEADTLLRAPGIGENQGRFVEALALTLQSVANDLSVPSLLDVAPEARKGLRSRCALIVKAMKNHPDALPATALPALEKATDSMEGLLNYVAGWVKLAIALALGIGTTVGWRRVVVTVGEKIGKTHLTYAQGGTAETVAAMTIMLADRYGLPVSTTHVLSSGVAGTMWANHSGLQGRTLAVIASAWVLTLPVSITLSFVLFFLFRFVR